jgi:hypothetical protein
VALEMPDHCGEPWGLVLASCKPSCCGTEEGLSMAQILVRNLQGTVVARLKKRAKERGRSLQAEVKTILEEAAQEDPGDFWKEAELIREDRDR